MLSKNVHYKTKVMVEVSMNGKGFNGNKLILLLVFGLSLDKFDVSRFIFIFVLCFVFYCYFFIINKLN